MPICVHSSNASTRRCAANASRAWRRVRQPLLLFVAALVPRLALVLLLRLPIGLDDMFQYDMLARSLAAGHGYRWYAQPDLDLIQRYIGIQVPPDYDPRGVPTSFRAPGYPAFLALVYTLSGSGPGRVLAARIAQAVLGAALAPLTWALAREAGCGPRASTGAALAIACFPLLIAYTLALASENLFTPLVALALWLLLRARERDRTAGYALAGLALGLAALTRSTIGAFVPLAAVWAWAARPWGSAALRSHLRQWAARAAGLTLAFLAVIAPWVARNSRLHGRLTWLETSLGYNLYLGYHPQSEGTFEYGISLDLLPILDDAERDARGREAAWRFVRDDPERVPLLVARKAGYLWEMDLRALTYFYSNGLLGRWPAWLLGVVLALDGLPWMGLATAALLGLAWGLPDRRKGLLLLLVVYYTAVHALTMAEPRFHVPLLPALAVAAAGAFERGTLHRTRAAQHALATLLIAALLANWGLQVAQRWDTLVALFGPHGATLGLPY